MPEPRPIRASRALLLGGCAGLAVGVAGSPIEACAFAWLAPALLLLAIEHAAPSTALLAGAALGTACNAFTMLWVVDLLETYASFAAIAAWPVASALWIGQALPWALAGWMASAWMRRGLAGWLALPACITVAGSIAPMLFPWRLGVSQMPDVVFVQLAEIGGAPILDLCLALGSCAALEAVRARRVTAVTIAAIAIGMPYAYGALRLPAVRAMREAAPALAVGVIQPNLGIFERSDPMLRESHLELHRSMTTQLEARGARLVIWPETSFPFAWDRAARTDSPAAHRRVLGDGVRGPVIFGALSHAGQARFNSVIAIDEDGTVAGVYDKVVLLAFGEYVPFWRLLPPLQKRFRPGLTPGPGPSTLRIAGTTVGALNCYEDLLAEHARRTAALDPGFLVNLSNDAWFGDSSAPHLHHMLARLRAVETRRDLVRAVNTGVSGLVHASGEDEHRTRPFERTGFVADVRLLSGTLTPWVRYGDVLTPALLGALGGFGLRRNRRAPGAR